MWLNDMRQSATVCDAYQDNRCNISIFGLGTLDNVNRGSGVQHEKDYTQTRPRRAPALGDHTANKGNDRKEHRCETLDELFVSMNTEIGNGHRVSLKEVNEPTRVTRICFANIMINIDTANWPGTP